MAAALFTAQFLLKIELNAGHLSPAFRARLAESEWGSPSPSVPAPGLEFPYKSLFNVDKIDVVRISEFYLKYLKLIKHVQ